MTYNLQGRTRISRQFRKLSPLMPSSKAPIRTVIFSFIISFWIPWLQLVPATERVRTRTLLRAMRCGTPPSNTRPSQVLQVLSLSSSISCLIVWLMLMVAFMRYKYWLVLPRSPWICASTSRSRATVYRTDRCASELYDAGYGVYRRSKPAYKTKARNWLLLLQPGIAIVGGTGVLLIFTFSSALWWDTSATVAEVFAVFGPVSLPVLA